MKTRFLIGSVALTTILLVANACGDPSPQRPRDVLLITIDTARADRFSYLARGGPGTPHVDRLAFEGVGFTQAISPAPLTLPAHASLMTGRQPPTHTVRDNGAYRLPEAEVTLAELLSSAGFETAAFIGAEVLDARYGLGQGFVTYDDEMTDPGDSTFLYYPERTAEQVVAAAIRWLEHQGERPIFAWVHLFDPHAPYVPPEPERSAHDRAYDGEIAYVDRMIGRLVDAWDEERSLDRTLVVVTADHGESLGEHGESTHGVLVHDATLRIPLVMRGPGVPAVAPIDAPVALVDVLPTLLELVGLSTPEEVQGRDLGPLLRGETVAWSPIAGYAESLYAGLHHGCAPLTTLREERWKFVRGASHELYDLAADPEESRDVVTAQPIDAERLATALEELTAELAAGPAQRLALDEASRRALESLGYVWSTTVGDSSEPLRDPREALRSLSLMAAADRLAFADDLEGAIAGYRAVIEVEPRSVDARMRLAQILISNNRAAEALEPLTQAAAFAPHEPLVHQKLGDTLFASGSYRESLGVFDAALERHPHDRRLRNGRWRCLNQLGRAERVLPEAESAIAADPGDAMARYARAIACCGADLSGFIAALQSELAELPGDPTLRRALSGATAERAGSSSPGH
jgi:choline-sulfatase